MVEEKELSEDCEEEEGGSSSSFCLKRARHAELIFGRMPEMVMAVMAQSLSPWMLCGGDSFNHSS